MNAEQEILVGGEYGQVEYEQEGFATGDFEDEEGSFEMIPMGAEEAGELDIEEGKARLTPDLNINSENFNASDNQILQMKAQKILKVLANFAELRSEEVTRVEYVDELKELYCQIYGYNAELMELFMKIFGPQEVVTF